MRRELLVLVSCLLGLTFGACAPEGPSGFVTFNLAPDSSCTYSPSSGNNMFFDHGLYDISPGGGADSTACDVPYRVHLLVNSFLKPNADTQLGRAEPNILQLHSAEVRLMTLQRETLTFDDEADPLPNPFLVTTNNSLFPAVGSTPSSGIAAVEVVPTAYAPYLSDFVGDQILAEIQIQGTTTGDVDVEFKPFDYPIEICDGCLTMCGSILTPELTRESFAMDQCDDNSGSDGRICFDPDC
jgi:hypothetical protein